MILSVLARNEGGEPGHNRYAVVASRSLGKAVRRNRAKRLLRAALRHHHPYIRPGHDIVLIARATIVGKNFAEVNQAVQELLSRAQLVVSSHDQIGEQSAEGAQT